MEYFDLHTTGIGYASRLREVKPRNGKPFWAVTINALTGPKDAEHRCYTRFDCRVCSDQALEAIQLARQAIDEQKAVLVGFRIGDIYPEAWESRDKDGNLRQGVVIKGRLIKVQFIKIDGEDLPLPGRDADTEVAPEEAAPAVEVTAITESAPRRFEPAAWLDKVAVRSRTHCVVKLEKDEAHFDEKRRYLKEQGFFFDRKTLSWRREIEAMVHNG